MKAKKTLAYLESHEKNTFTVLMNKVNKMTELDTLLRAELPPLLAMHCRLANIRQGQLIIQADSPVWGTKLRFELIPLLSRLRQHPRFAGLSGIDYFVAPFALMKKADEAEIKAAALPLSAPIRQLLLDTANTVSNPLLRSVLERIAFKNTE